MQRSLSFSDAPVLPRPYQCEGGIDRMRPQDRTDIGGVQEAFLTTHWSLIEAVESPEQDKTRDLLGLLLQ